MVGAAPQVDDGASASRGGVVLGVTQLMGRLVQLGFLLVVTRTVSSADFGRFSLVVGLLILGGFLADAGTTPALVRLSSREPGDAGLLLGGTLLVSVGLGLLAWGLVVGVAAAVYGDPVSVDTAIAGASLPLTAATTSMFGVLDGIGRISARAWASLAQPLVGVGLGAVVVATTDDIRSAMWMLAFAAAVSATVAAATVRRAPVVVPGLRPDPVAIRRVFRVALSFAVLSGLGSLSSRFDVLLLGAWSGRSDAASYDVALRATEAVWSLHAVVTAPMLFLLSRRLGQGDVPGAQRAYVLAIRLSYAVGGLASALLLTFHDQAVDLLGAADYPDAATALAILGGSLWLTLVALVQGVLILAGDHVRRGITVAAAVTAATVVMDLVLIGAYGTVGAAWAGAATSALTVVAFGWLHHVTLGLATPLPPMGMIAAAAVALALPRTVQVPDLLAVMLASAAYVGVLVASGALRIEDVTRIATAVRRSRAG
jgi:O-antigen/teichoic acid export membrane protein